MELCTNLQQRVLDLEKTKTTQQNEIASLKRRVKKLEQKKRSRTHGLKRLHKVGMSRRVVSSGDEEDLEMFDVGTLTGDEVFAEQEVAAKGVNLTVDEVTLAQALAALKSVKPKEKIQDKGKGKMVEPEPVKPTKKKVQIMLDEDKALKIKHNIDEEERILSERLQAEEHEQFTIKEKAILFKELLEQRRKHFTAKRAEEKRNKPPTKTQQKKTMIIYLKNMEGWKQKYLKSKDFDSIKELFDKAFKRVNTFVDFRTDLVEEVTIDAIPLVVKYPRFVDWKIHKKGKKSYYQILRADGKSQMYMIFSHMLKSFDREDLEDLYKLVKAKYESTRQVEDLDLVLWNDLKNMFEPHVEDMNKNQQGYKVLEWKLYDSFTAALIDVNAAQSKLVLLNFNENYSKYLRLLYKVMHAEGVNAAGDESYTAEIISTAIKDLVECTTKRHQRNSLNRQQYETSLLQAKEMLIKHLIASKSETMSMDNLYNNLKVYEPEVKGMSSLSSSTKNMAFVSSSNNNTSSTNKAVNTAHGVSTALLALKLILLTLQILIT
ncbi:hypothetical protein Tco_0018519 [Tanacetum coccineum]